jgi:hypothetical protein
MYEWGLNREKPTETPIGQGGSYESLKHAIYLELTEIGKQTKFGWNRSGYSTCSEIEKFWTEEHQSKRSLSSRPPWHVKPLMHLRRLTNVVSWSKLPCMSIPERSKNSGRRATQIRWQARAPAQAQAQRSTISTYSSTSARRCR